MSQPQRAWQRLKLNIAEWLVLSIPLQSHYHNSDLILAADKIRDFRQRYYMPPQDGQQVGK